MPQDLGLEQNAQNKESHYRLVLHFCPNNVHCQKIYLCSNVEMFGTWDLFLRRFFF